MTHSLAGALLALSLLATSPHAAAPDSAALATLLHQFLAGAAHDDVAMHDRFWADDLIYTGASGRRIGKADILRDVRAATPPAPGDPRITYGAEDVRIQQYGTTAVVAFRLVATTVHGDTTSVARYLNTGVFVRRDGTWRAVGWQATKQP